MTTRIKALRISTNQFGLLKAAYEDKITDNTLRAVLDTTLYSCFRHRWLEYRRGVLRITTSGYAALQCYYSAEAPMRRDADLSERVQGYIHRSRRRAA